MSRPPTYARKVDDSHRAVVAAFGAAGCSVVPIQSPRAGLPDLVVGVAGRTLLVEVKNPLGKGVRTSRTVQSAAQLKFAESWRGSPVHVVRCAADAMALANLVRMCRPGGGGT